MSLLFFKNISKRLSQEKKTLEKVKFNLKKELKQNNEKLGQCRQDYDTAFELYFNRFCQEIEKENPTVYVVQECYLESNKLDYDSIWRNWNEATDRAKYICDNEFEYTVKEICFSDILIHRVLLRKLLEDMAQREIDQ